ELGRRKSLRQKALPERSPRSTVEERIEHGVEAIAIAPPLHEDRGKGVAHDPWRRNTDSAARSHGVDGLRRRDVEARPPKHPEELVDHAEQRLYVRHRQK